MNTVRSSPPVRPGRQAPFAAPLLARVELIREVDGMLSRVVELIPDELRDSIDDVCALRRQVLDALLGGLDCENRACVLALLPDGPDHQLA